ncbi:unnamed protein product [Heligmosomoides polygyrus]|uniref:Uncharacterized protein n=1 Tax=Heligmosomoides polygyrus TaxID=6339 RepID=A0A183FE95_HELPZ|nr:unnamed protein product [Heligmosomoides polygyrus]
MAESENEAAMFTPDGNTIAEDTRMEKICAVLEPDGVGAEHDTNAAGGWRHRVKQHGPAVPPTADDGGRSSLHLLSLNIGSRLQETSASNEWGSDRGKQRG